MQNRKKSTNILCAILVPALLSLGACSQIIEKPLMSFSENLANAVLSQSDPQLVRDGAPSFILLTEGFIRQQPDSVAMRNTAAQMYSLYTAAFVNDPERSKRLSASANKHGAQAFCLSFKLADCNLNKIDFSKFEQYIKRARLKDIDALASLSTSWLVWIRSNAEDWSALAQLPKIELVLKRMVELEENYADGSAKLYLGILNGLRPPALGGKPELAKQYFEDAIAISNGKNLSAKVEYAKSYARTLYERELHDRLLQEVLGSDPQADGFTMSNMLAQEEAQQLLDSADDYF